MPSTATSCQTATIQHHRRGTRHASRAKCPANALVTATAQRGNHTVFEQLFFANQAILLANYGDIPCNWPPSHDSVIESGKRSVLYHDRRTRQRASGVNTPPRALQYLPRVSHIGLDSYPNTFKQVSGLLVPMCSRNWALLPVYGGGGKQTSPAHTCASGVFETGVLDMPLFLPPGAIVRSPCPRCLLNTGMSGMLPTACRACCPDRGMPAR